MAIEVKFEGYVLEVVKKDWGNILRVSHQRRAKSDAGVWETVGYDYLDVTTEDFSVDKGDIVSVVGTLKKGDVYTKKDGTQDCDLKVRATSITKVERNQQPSVDADDRRKYGNGYAPF